MFTRADAQSFKSTQRMLSNVVTQQLVQRFAYDEMLDALITVNGLRGPIGRRCLKSSARRGPASFALPAPGNKKT